MNGREFLGCSQDVFHRNAPQDAPFCTRENWQGAVLFLTQELSNLGLPSPCSSEDGQGNNLDVISLVNIAFELVQSYKRCLKTIADIESQVQRLQCDLEQSRSNTTRQREVIESKKRQMYDHAERERQANEKLEQEREKQKMSKDEIRKLISTLNHRDTLWTYDLKRRDLEIAKLKTRLVKVLADKTAEKPHMSVQIHYPSDGETPPTHGSGRGMNKSTRWTEAKERWSEKLQKDVDYLNGELSGLQDVFRAHAQGLLKTLGQETDLADVLRMPLSLSHANIVALAKGLQDDVTEVAAERARAVELSEAVAAFEGRLEAGEGKSCEEDAALLTELKSMFSDGKELLRANHRILEKEKASVRAQRALLDQRQADIDTIRKELLIQYDGSDFEDPELGPSIEEQQRMQGPSWSRRESNAGGIPVDPRKRTFSGKGDGSRPPSRPGSRPGSKPGSRSHSTARREANMSPFQGILQQQPQTAVTRRLSGGTRAGVRPRSTNMSPQRIMTTTLAGRESPYQQQQQQQVSGSSVGRRQSKWRTTSVSPAGTLTRANYKTKSLPRPGAGRQLSLTLPPSSPPTKQISVFSDSDSNNANPASENTISSKRPRRPDRSEEEGKPPSSSSEEQGGRKQMDELAAQLDKLGSYIQRREQNEVQTSESEMEEHLQGIREALNRSKREEEEDK